MKRAMRTSVWEKRDGTGDVEGTSWKIAAAGTDEAACTPVG